MKCKECDEENDIYCDGDGPLMCPECRTVDELEMVYDEDFNRIEKKERVG
jgi:phage FluMu protein Com